MPNTYNNIKKPRAKKSLGQNFLVDDNISRKIVNTLKISPKDHILEIGPGHGALTQWIHEENPASFTVLEKDEELAERLSLKWPGIEVKNGDALDFSWNLAPSGLKVIGNLPYNIASKLIWDMAADAVNIWGAVFMVQHEVGLRLTAKPGNKQYSGLSVWVQSHMETNYLFKVGADVFRPKPRIDSAVIIFFPKAVDQRPEYPDKLSALIKTCFQKRRKQIGNILKSLWSSDIENWLAREGLARTCRPEELSPVQFQGLAKLLKDFF